MTDLSKFAITKKWPALHPDRIQLYSVPTPNGVKVAAMLEETALPTSRITCTSTPMTSCRRNFYRSIPITRYRPYSIPMAGRQAFAPL